MALVQLGDIVTDMRGVVGGVVYQRNAYGLISRTRVVPTNPQTTPQQTRRGYFGNAAQAWLSLTPSERQAWIDLDPPLTMTNVFGVEVALTGYNAFVRVNENILSVGGSILTTPPSPVSLPLPVFSSFDFDLSNSRVRVTFPIATAPYALQLFISNNLIVSRQAYMKTAHLVRTLASGATLGTVNSYTEYIARFASTPPTDSQQRIIAQYIDISTGYRSLPYTLTTFAL